MSNGLVIGLIVLLFVLIIASAFFSAAETAYSSVSQSKIEINAKKGKKSAKLIQKHSKTFGWTLATILIFNNLVNISAAALITFLFTKLMGASGTAAIISTFVMTPIIVIFGEITPKLLAKKYAYGYLTKIAYIMEAFNILLFPITYPLSKIVLQSSVTNSEIELKSLIDIAKVEGVLDRNEAELASKALDLDSTTVNKIMVKKQSIAFVNIDSNIGDVLAKFKSTGYSRLFVKKNNEYVGLVLLKDIFLVERNDELKKYIVDVTKISQHILATKALETMRLAKSQLSLVMEKQDSSKVVGVVSIEDIVEELVGEIYDEHDADMPVREIAHYKWSVIGSTPIEELENEVGIIFEKDDDEDSVKQWIQSRINRKIKKGLKYSYKDIIVFKIISNKNNEETLIEVTKK